jgi:flavin reductase (DIM6/NTAB) family NADH-FMN oxidoreductase RutF
MSKINIGTNAFTQPMPVTLLGTQLEKKANFMTLAWVTRINANPPLLAVGVNKFHQTNHGIRNNKTFSINIPSENMIIETDYCGLVSGRKQNKSDIFDVFYGELETAPMIKECPVNMECELFKVVDLPTNDLFIGEIKAVYTEKKYLTDDNMDIKKINPFVLTMPDNNYWKIGSKVGKAWNDGKNFRVDHE